MGLSVTRRAKFRSEKICPEILHTDLARVVLGCTGRQVAACDFAGARRLLAGAVKGQRKAAQHRGNNPTCVTFTQQESGSLTLCIADVTGSGCDVIDQDPGDGVGIHGHWCPPYGCGRRHGSFGPVAASVASLCQAERLRGGGDLVERIAPTPRMIREESRILNPVGCCACEEITDGL